MYLSVNHVVLTILLHQCLTICTGENNDTENGKSLFVNILLPFKNAQRSISVQYESD